MVLFGATGFAGRYAAEYLARSAPSGLRWTLAGRREEAVQAMLRKVGHPEPGLRADVADPESLDALAASARVVLSTVGPFSRYGTRLVEACVRHRAHYADITGEVPWVRGLIDQYHAEARDGGVRIVPMCGFDSVPSDVGSWHLVREIRQRWGVGTATVTAVFTLRGGGLNGGTFDTLLTQAERFRTRELANPFALVPDMGDRPRSTSVHADPRGPVFDPVKRGRWVAPFFMGPINTRVVRRSAWLYQDHGQPYGSDFGYQEYQDVRGGAWWRAQALTMGLGATFWLTKRAWGRDLLRRIGPKPGEGPSEAAVARGSIRVRYRAVAEDGRALTAELRSDGDAGNVSTARFLVEAGLTLATLDPAYDLAPGTGGILTPAYALGAPYVARLRQAGVTLDVDPIRES
jgi:short subunit dehydrogenase-like uncharacterized protein